LNNATTPTVKLIHQGDFCEIVSEDLREYGLKRGNYVFIAGHQSLPMSAHDPYTQRVTFMCHKCTREGEVDMEAGFFLLDPKSLFRLPDEQIEEMYEVLTDQLEKAHLVAADSPSESEH
jgi:hypothetical protein